MKPFQELLPSDKETNKIKNLAEPPLPPPDMLSFFVTIVPKLSKAVVGCTGLYWPVLGLTRLFLAVVGCAWLYWGFLGCTGLYLAAVCCCGL